MARVTLENYASQLKDVILPILFKKIDSFDFRDGLLENVIDLSKRYCYESKLNDELGVAVLDDLGKRKLSFNDEGVEAASLFVLSAVYYLTALNVLQSEEISSEDSTYLGFRNSTSMFRLSLEAYDFRVLQEFANMSDDDVKAVIQQKLKLTIGSCSIEEYFDNHIYIQDMDIVLETLQPEKDERKDLIADALAYSKTQITIAVTKTMKTYKSLFSSAYQVVKPVGLLTSNGIAYLKDGILQYSESHETHQINQYLTNLLNMCESTSRDFDLNLVVSNYLDSSKQDLKLYFPKKLLEFAFGCSSYSNKNNGNGVERYPAISDVRSWDEYAKDIVKPVIEDIYKNTAISLFEKKGFMENEGYKTSQAFELLKGMLNYMYKNLTSCMIISNWKEAPESATDLNSSATLVGFKIRVADVDHKIPLSTQVPKYIIDNIFGGLKGDDDAVCETVVPLGSSSDYTVCDIQHKFSPSLVNGEPLFAYTAQNSLKKSGKTPSWENLIIGKKDDDSILTVGEDISFNKKLVHWVLAGSRSGKGVMTLNILAGALASNKPVFYLDNKPDMASMFRSSQLSGGRMFCINGDYDTSFDETFHSCHPDSFNWSKNIPPFVREVLGNDYSNYAPIFYLRAVMFLTSLIYVRGSVRTESRLYEPLGGEKGIAIVIDEISAADSAISAMLDKNGVLGRNFYSAPTLTTAESCNNLLKKNKDDKGIPVVSEFGCYSTDLIRSLNETFRTIGGQWKLKGLTGGGTEGDVSNIFMIGQNIRDVDTSKLEYIPTNDDNMNRTSGDAFYNFLFNLGCDAFFGYNVDHPEYMWSGDEAAADGSKASTRLNATARNFAYVNHFDEGTVKTMLDNKVGGKSSKDISDSAVYFKPFLIFNDAKEDSPYVAQDFKRTCELARLDFEKIKNMHRRANGVLEPEIGFIPYVNAQGSEADSIQSVLAKSYDIANHLIWSYGYKGDCIEFIYDLRPEAMFTAQSLLNAYRGSSKEEVSKLYSKYFSNQDVSRVVDADIKDVDGVDYNNLNKLMGYDTQKPSESNVYEAMKSYANLSLEQQIRQMINNILNKHPELRTVFTKQLIDEFVPFYLSYKGGAR